MHVFFPLLQGWEHSRHFCNILVLSGTFQNILRLVIKDENHPTYTSEVLDDSLSVTVHVTLLLAQYIMHVPYHFYACVITDKFA